ncbi:MAG: PIN domain-containing protein [Gemmatimonadales bacterium]
MIYVDTSVALAQLLAEDRRPPESLWSESLVSSRLLEYELWNRIHARGLTASHSEAARDVLGRVAMLEMLRPILQRATEPFPVTLRTLDALHLASIDFLRSQGVKVRLASYDERQLKAAARLEIPIHGL